MPAAGDPLEPDPKNVVALVSAAITEAWPATESERKSYFSKLHLTERDDLGSEHPKLKSGLLIAPSLGAAEGLWPAWRTACYRSRCSSTRILGQDLALPSSDIAPFIRNLLPFSDPRSKRTPRNSSSRRLFGELGRSLLKCLVIPGTSIHLKSRSNMPPALKSTRHW